MGSAPQVNDLCGLPAGAATCSGEAPHALLFDTARGATPDELATLFQHAAAFRYDARQYAADARLGEGGERARVRLHTAGCCVASHPRPFLCTHGRFLPSRSPFEPRQSDPPSLQQGAQGVMIAM